MDFISLKTIIESCDYNLELLKERGYNFKDALEVKTFCQFVEFLHEDNVEGMVARQHTAHFVYGYNIPQIGKEFDFLRIGNNYNINIELKSESDFEKQEKQLLKNHHYLNFLDNVTYYFSYSAKENRLIKLDSTGMEATKISVLDLKNCLINQNFIGAQNNYDNYFEPKNYLISPFNNTEKFLNKEYFLTPHQEIIRKEVLDNDFETVIIKGGAGTGKSVLLYDLALSLKEDSFFKNVTILHCGNLNDGHRLLNSSQKYRIIPMSRIKFQGVSTLFRESTPEIILIDETQRIYPDQLMELKNFADENDIKLYFFLDPYQDFWDGVFGETRLEEIIEYSEMKNGRMFSLKNKIRTNSEFQQVIDLLFSHTEADYHTIENDKLKISIKFFSQPDEEFIEYINWIESIEYKVLGYTPTLYENKEDIFKPFKKLNIDKPHDVIGQEFQKVAVILNKNFEYVDTDSSYRLKTVGESYYSGINMLYQNLTRSIDRIEIIIVDNQDLFVELVKLFKKI